MPRHTESTAPDALPTGIGRPAEGAFVHAGITRLEQFTELTEKQVLQIHGVGPKAVGVLKLALQARGLSFRPG